MKTLLMLLTTILCLSTSAAEVDCRGEHFTNSSLFGGSIEGECDARVNNKKIKLTYDINIYGVGWGASTRSIRKITLDLDANLLKKLEREGVLDLEKCNGGAFSIGWIGGVSYSKICAREYSNAPAKACIKFSGGLLYSGVGAELGARCDKFRLIREY